jgi:uncharacterized protein
MVIQEHDGVLFVQAQHAFVAVKNAVIATIPVLTKAHLDSQTLHATHVFMQRIIERYPVREAILFGSRARQTHVDNSDADIAIILNSEGQNKAVAIRDMAAIAFHVMMETGVMVEALPLWDNDIDRPYEYINPVLIKNILSEGVHL